MSGQPAAMSPAVISPHRTRRTRPGPARCPCRRPADPGEAPEVHTEVVVRNLARRARGYARITDEGTIRWQRQFAAPGNPASGLAPPDAAQAIAAALQEYRAVGNGGTR